MSKVRRVEFAPGTKKALSKVVTSKAQIADLKVAVTDLQTKSIGSLIWDGRVSKLDTAPGKKNRLYVFRAGKTNRLVFSDDNDGIYVHDVLDMTNKKSVSGKAFKIKEG